jgi:carbonic anhydrase
MIDIIYRYDPNVPLAPPPASAAEARARLCEGNRNFVGLADRPEGGARSSRVIPLDLQQLGVADAAGVAPRQRPFAVVLGCSDARVPTEMIFGQACNALFVVRVAGNVLGNECLGSIDYAVRHLGTDLHLLVVLGHSECGAVTAAVDTFLDPARYLTVAASQALRAVVDRLLVAVRAAAHALEEVHGAGVSRSAGYRRVLIQTAVVLNAALTARTLAQEIREFDPAQMQVVYGIYDLVSREVNLSGDAGKGVHPMLYDPPENEEAFRRLARKLAGYPTIPGLLGQPA